MRRREIIGVLGSVAAWSVAARAQQRATPVIGLLSGASLQTMRQWVAAFHLGLADAGFTEDRNVMIEYRWAEGNNDRLPGLAMDLVRRAFFQGLQNLGYVDGRTIDIRYLSADNDDDGFPTLIDECLSLKPAVIAVTTTPAAHLLKKATSTIPIVMMALGDPLGTALVDNLSHPSGNITGMSSMVPELAVKRLELLRELVPGISRVLVLSYLADPIAPLQVKAMEQAAASFGLTLQVRDSRMGEDIPAAFEAGTQERAVGLLLTSESMFIVHRARVTELAARHRLPAVYPFVLPVRENGGLMAYAVRAPDLHRSAAMYVHRILNGAKPADLPVQQPTKFELVLNLKTAAALGLTISPTLLARADEVIE